MLGVKGRESFFIVRFVDMAASHDTNASGLSLDAKAIIIRKLQRYGKVFISSEGRLPEQ